MSVYYNDNEPYAAAWLRNLISAGLIPVGDVDERPIQEVMPDDLRRYTQCHFFAGIGGWACASRLAGVANDFPVWTGSCPCQPFSAAGKREGFADPRHLWPEWFRLIRECRPSVVFGEQVAGAIGGGWLDAVFTDLEGEGYACGAAVLPACGVGAPHIRQRLWFVADMQVKRRDARRSSEASRRTPVEPPRYGDDRELAHPNPSGRSEQRSGGLLDRERPALRDDADGRGFVGDADDKGLEGRLGGRGGADQRIVRPSGMDGFWTTCDWLPCTDGKARPVEPGSFPLAHGVQRRASKLRAYGNAIVPQAAAEFIKAHLAMRPS